MTSALTQLPRAAALFSAIVLSTAASGCVTITAENAADPYEGFNRQMFAFNDGLDRNVLEPIATGYRAITNEPVREGVGNFTANLGEPVTLVNHILQGKLPDAGATLGRFVINTTIGIGGIFDPASSMGIARTKEDFGQTLGVWGVPQGPFLVMPFIGPTSPRDLAGIGGDIALNPLNYPEFDHDDEIRVGVLALGGVNARAGAQDTFDNLRTQVDPYTTMKRIYERTRASDIGQPYEQPKEDQELPKSELDF